MPTVYLFRIDGSKDNDAFFNALSPSAAHVYAGIDFRVGTIEWIPDLVRVDVDDLNSRCVLTIIELEATESEALRSCRKFLPENSTAIVQALTDYLGRVIRDCQARADRRADDFRRLKAVLSEAKHITVTTAGALRSSTKFVEDRPLIDQPKFDSPPRPIETEDQIDSREFRGTMRLGAGDAKAVARCVMILDAVVRSRDHSVAIFRTWRGQNRSQPLKYLLIHNPGIYPNLRSFLFEKGNSGLMLNFEAILADLTELWSLARKKPIEAERIRALISSYYPVANKVTSHEAMTGIFEVARRHLSENFSDLVPNGTDLGP